MLFIVRASRPMSRLLWALVATFSVSVTVAFPLPMPENDDGNLGNAFIQNIAGSTDQSNIAQWIMLAMGTPVFIFALYQVVNLCGYRGESRENENQVEVEVSERHGNNGAAVTATSVVNRTCSLTSNLVPSWCIRENLCPTTVTQGSATSNTSIPVTTSDEPAHPSTSPDNTNDSAVEATPSSSTKSSPDAATFQ